MGTDDNEKAAATASPNRQAETDIREQVIEVVSEKTGYPKEMLDLELDLEADLGIDTAKQVEILWTICGIYNFPHRENLVRRRFPTLAHLIEFFSRELPKLGGSAPFRADKTQEDVDVSERVSVLDQPALNDIGDVVAAAKEVFGPDRGLRWLGTPVPALNYATPISLADTPDGRQEIHNALVNLAHGNW